MEHVFFLSCFCQASASGHLLGLVGDVIVFYVTFPCGILGQVWYLIVSFSDLCHLSYFKWVNTSITL